MARVLLTIHEVGVAIEVQERLEREGHAVVWDVEKRPKDADCDLVIMAGGDQLAQRIRAWRGSPSVPAMILIGGPNDQAIATHHGVTLLTSTETLLAAIEQALTHRFGASMGPHIARAALGLESGLEADALRESIVRCGTTVSSVVVRDALEPRRAKYISTTPLFASLREARALEVPDVEIGTKCSGDLTLKTLIETVILDPLETGKRVWALSCAGALRLTDEPVQDGRSETRRVRGAREHVQARSELAMPTAYDVLDLTRGAYVEDVEESVRALGFRYAPAALASLDLGDLAEAAAAHWTRILEAREAIYYEAGQEQLNAFIDGQLREKNDRLSTSWGHPCLEPKTAAAAFARGQAALSAGDVFKALSEMAAAARAHPNHPVYEAYLAWARYRSDVARGGQRGQTAARERTVAEEGALGRRPFAQSLVAIGLLCVATGDAESARWHLRESLALQPDLPAAQMILRRL